MVYDFDLFIVGAGPAGLAAAKQACQYGVNVAIAEQNHLGGCCVNRGCIPKKLMVYAADYAAAMQTRQEYGWEKCDSQFQWQRFRAKQDQELERLRQLQQRSLQKLGITVLYGHTRFLDAHTLQVQEQRYTTDKVLIAVGGKPLKPDIPGIEYAITSDQLFSLDHLPQRIAIIGGGYIGVEFSSIFQGFGCEVTVMNRESCILEGFDQDLQTNVREGLIRRGIHSFCSTTTDLIEQTTEGLCLHLTGDCPEKVVADVVLCAVGRAPNLENLGLETAGVEFDQKAIAVDRYSCTTQPHIYAVGDCTNRKQLTPVAKAEGQAAVDVMFGQSTRSLDYHLIPSAIFSRPEAASVGLTEAEAKEQFGDTIAAHCQQFVPLKYSFSDRKPQALIKLVVDRSSDQVLGIHMVGEDAAEVIQAGAIALYNALTQAELLRTIGIHPSTLEELFTF